MKKVQYIVTERAHFMCPNMHFGIKARFKGNYSIEKIKETLEALENAHRFLKSKISAESTTGKLYYKYFDELHIPIIERTDSSLWVKDYQALTENGWDVFHECLLKVISYPEENGFELLFAAHHLLADGRGILSLICEFASYYADGISPQYAEEQLIGTIRDLPKNSDLSMVNRIIINKANRDWSRENHTVSYKEYQNFERAFIRNNPIGYTVETLEREKVDELNNICKEHNISLNDYLVAEMMCREKTNRIVIAIDIRKRIACYREGALGNYATAASIENRNRLENVIETAKQVSGRIKQRIGNTQKSMMILACYLRLSHELIDAAAISTLGGFQSKAGKFVGSLILGYEKRTGYSVTNLGNVENPNIEEAVFIPPASPANRKTMGVLSINRRMKKCTVFYENTKTE